MATTSRVDIREADGIKIVRFVDQHLFDERTVREVSEQIASTLPNDGTPIKIVVNFTGVSLISSSLLSKLILLQRRVDNSGGKLRLCEISPVLQQVFRTSNLDRLFHIDRDQLGALDSFR